MRLLRSIAVLSLALAAAACAATKAGRADDIRFSGFLSSYEGLEQTGDSGRAAFRWVKPGLDLSGYDSILLDAPVARMSPEMQAEIGEEDLAYLLGALDAAFRDELGARFTLTDHAGPRTLRIRTCLSESSSTAAVLTVARVVPAGIVLSKTKQLATGTGINVGKASGELEVLDSQTGERLLAAVDRRVGTGVARNVFSSWGDVTSAFSWWADRTASRLRDDGMQER